MTVATFAKRMEAICRLKDTNTVKKEGMKLIMVELGDGVPAYLETLELFLDRLNGVDGIGGTDGFDGFGN